MKTIGEKYGKTNAQVALRRNTQRSIVIIPKSAKKERMCENIDLFDFTLTDDEMHRLSLFDENKSMWFAYDDPNYVQNILTPVRDKKVL